VKVLFVKNVWNGKTYSLAKHYWLFLVIPSAIFGGVAIAIDENSLSDWAPMAAALLLALGLPVHVVGYVGLFNCARHQKWRGWASTAVVFATLGILISVEKTFRPVESWDMEKEMATTNRQLPKKIGDGVTFTKAVYNQQSHDVTLWFSLETDEDINIDYMNGWVAAQFCPELQGRYSNVRKLRMVVSTPDNSTTVVEITKQDCKQD
jgi:hypothetical protein